MWQQAPLLRPVAEGAGGDLDGQLRHDGECQRRLRRSAVAQRDRPSVVWGRGDLRAAGKGLEVQLQSLQEHGPPWAFHDLCCAYGDIAREWPLEWKHNITQHLACNRQYLDEVCGRDGWVGNDSSDGCTLCP